MVLEEKKREFISIIEHITDSTPTKIKQEIFIFLRKHWSELGGDESLGSLVCSKLGISKRQFNLFLNNTDLVFGSETLQRNLKPGSWLYNYLEYTSTSESPEDFHLWVGLTVLSCALRRKVYYDGGHYKTYPNLFTILVSPPGLTRKTTAIRIGTSILSNAIPDFKVVSEKITPEALTKRLATPTDKKKASGGIKSEVCAEGIAIAPELTVFLGREQYNEGLIILLTRLYDCDKVDRETVGRGVEPVNNVWFSLLGGTTPTEISKAIPSSAGGGGLMSRLNIIYRETTPREFPLAVEVDKTMQEWLISELARINNEVSGPITMTEDGKEWWIKFYKDNKKMMERPGNMNMERQADHVVKIATILTASENEAKINADIFGRAYNIVNASKQNTSDISRLVDANDRSKSAQFIMNTIKRFGGRITRHRLIKYSYHKIGDVFHVDNAINTLLEAELIKCQNEGKTRVYILKDFEEVFADD